MSAPQTRPAERTAASQPVSRRQAFRVEGLDCAEEIRVLRRQLEPLPGVNDLQFDVLQARMVVDRDAATISDDEIVRQVALTGMQARTWSSAAESAGWWQRRGPLVTTAIGAVLLAAGFALHAALGGGVLAALSGSEFAVPWIVRACYLASLAASLWFTAPKAWRAIIALRPDMNLLMSVAVVGAIATDEWFEAVTVAFLFSLALLLEHWSMARARGAIAALMQTAPPTARVREPDGDDRRYVETPVEDVPVDSIVSVRPGEKVPLDGVVVAGNSSVDEAPITGESVPRGKGPGDEVYAGTINEDGALEVRVTRYAEDSTLARMIHMVEEAQSRRAPTQRWVETFAQYYTPAMMTLALAVVLVGPLLLNGAWDVWFYRGLVLLVIACPCALVISTPVSIVSALTSASRRGVLIKGGLYLEAAASLRAMAVDKTGTLTSGRPEVQEVVPLDGHTAEDVLRHAAALEANSQHPLGRAIVRRARAEGVEFEPAEDHQALQGLGVEGRVAGQPCWIGSHGLLHQKGGESPETHDKAVELERRGYTVVAVGADGQLLGLIALADELRPASASVVAELHGAGIRNVVMLTGDNEATAAEIARAAGIDDYRAELLPADKVAAVEELTRQHGQVAMVGDGVNDAPAMAASTLGIAMGAIGSDAAIEAADVALATDDLQRIPWLIRHARRARAVVRQNITLALGLKLAVLLLSVVGFASLWMAIAADMGASLLVIANGMRLLRA